MLPVTFFTTNNCDGRYNIRCDDRRDDRRDVRCDSKRDGKISGNMSLNQTFTSDEIFTLGASCGAKVIYSGDELSMLSS